MLALVWGAGGAVRDVVASGRVVVSDGRCVSVDVDALADDVAAAHRRLLRTAGLDPRLPGRRLKRQPIRRRYPIRAAVRCVASPRPQCGRPERRSGPEAAAQMRASAGEPLGRGQAASSRRRPG